jgi:hypothetical protein
VGEQMGCVRCATGGRRDDVALSPTMMMACVRRHMGFVSMIAIDSNAVCILHLHKLELSGRDEILGSSKLMSICAIIFYSFGNLVHFCCRFSMK